MDEGQNWVDQSVNIDPNDGIYIDGVSFDTLKTVIVGSYNGDDGGIFITEDGGDNWEITLLPESKTFLRDIEIVDSSTWWIAGDDVIFRTTDAGKSWKKKPDIPGTNLDLFVLDEKNMWLAGYTRPSIHFDGRLYKFTADTPQCLEDIQAELSIDTLLSIMPTFNWQHAKGCIDGYQMKIGTTEGSDDLISLIDLGRDTTFTLTQPLPENTTVFVTISPYGLSGQVSDCSSFQYHTEGSSSTQNSLEFIEQFLVFPNPASEVINIYIKTKGHYPYTLGLHDITGRSVKTIIDQQMSVSELPSGFYLLRLRTQDGVATRKISITH